MYKLQLNLYIMLMFFLAKGCTPSTGQWRMAITADTRVVATHEQTLHGADFTCGAFQEPLGLAVDANENLYVVDSGNHRICKFDRELQFVSEFGQFGWGAGQLQHPTDVALDREVNVYVVDAANDRIEKFNANGAHFGTFYTNQNADGGLHSVWPDRQGGLYLTDQETDQIVRLASTGEPERVMGGYGFELGYLNRPQGIWVAANGEVIVADYGNQRAQIFNAVGNPLHVIALPDSIETTVTSGPLAITGDGYGRLFIATQTAVHVFTMRGEFLQTIRLPDLHRQSLIGDIALSRQGRLFISDRSNQVIYVYRVE